jgi:putative hemolysin
MSNWKTYLFLTIGCLMVQGFYAMLEMACVSFNKVRLQYYVSKGHKRAKWLSYLLNRPTLLFGTTLIGVNASLQFGSECSRRLYESLGVSPDWAPLTQVFLVLVFAEIAPMFAGRRYAEHAAMLGIPIIYATSIVLRPFIWLLNLLCQAINRLIKSPVASGLYLTREELQNVLEEWEDTPTPGEPKEFNTIVSNIFSLKNKTAKELMIPIRSVQQVPAFCTVAEMRSLLTSAYTPYLPLYHKNPENIVAIAYPRDLLRLPENKRIREHARPPWFIVENASILQILKQFRRNNQSVAVVLNESGLAVGMLTLDEIVDEIFGETDDWMSFGDISPRAHHVVVDRTFPGEMRLEDFNKQFHVHLEFEDAETLAEVMEKALGHPPVKEETVRIDQFELTAEEIALFGAKSVTVRTIF